MRAALPTWLRRMTLAVGFIALAVIAVQVGFGPFRIDGFGVRFSSHSLARPVLVFIVAAVVLLRGADRQAAIGDLRRLSSGFDGAAPWFALVAALGALTAGLVWGTRAAGGSDSYCYIGQAEEFAAGRAILREPLATVVSLPRVDLVFAPVGFVPSPSGGAVPMCAPGLSLVMALAWTIGGERFLHLVVPTFGALSVWATFLLGRRLYRATAGAWAAILLCVQSRVPLPSRATDERRAGGGALVSRPGLDRPRRCARSLGCRRGCVAGDPDSSEHRAGPPSARRLSRNHDRTAGRRALCRRIGSRLCAAGVAESDPLRVALAHRIWRSRRALLAGKRHAECVAL